MVGRGCEGLPALGGDGFEGAGAADGEAVATDDMFGYLVLLLLMIDG